MHSEHASRLTPKAEQTRQRILESALGLFAAQGYDATTMREIAAAAECSLGLAYRYFSGKEALVLALYWRMAAQTAQQVEQLAAASIADRFHAVMTQRLSEAAPFREAFGAMFGAAANPASGINVLGEPAFGMRSQALAAFRRLVDEASDAPDASKARQLAALLYSLHFALILFWLFDRSPDQHVTQSLLDFIRDMLAVLRRALVLPPVAGTIARLVRIIEPVFVGE